MAAEQLARIEPREPVTPDALTSLLSRLSVPPRLLVEPGPDAAQTDLILKAAMRAPDHGNLKPVRFILVRGGRPGPRGRGGGGAWAPAPPPRR